MVTERRKDELVEQGFLEELEGSTHIPGTPKVCMSLVCVSRCSIPTVMAQQE